MRPPPRGGMLVKTILAVVVLAMVAAGAWLVLKPKTSARESAHGTLDLAKAEIISFDMTTTALGELQAKNQIELNSELETESSIVELVPEGKAVKKGELILRLSGDQIQTQIDETKLRVESAKADLVAADSGYEIQKSENESRLRQARLKLDLAELALKQWESGDHVQKMKDIELALDKSSKDLERLEEKFVRSQGLFKEGFMSKDELQKEEIELRNARAALEKAKLDDTTYQNYQKPKDQKSKLSDVEEARAELERTKQQAEIQLAIKDAERVNKRRQLALHEEKLAKLEKQLAATEIRAPQDGLVVYASSAGRNWFDDSPFTVGRRVRPQEPLIVLPDTSEMVAAVRVQEALAGRIRPGQTASVKVDMLGGQVLSGKVDSIGVMAESQGRWMDPNRREYTVKIALDKTSSDLGLKPSNKCEATITMGRVEDTLAVPVQGVFSDEALKFVYVPRSGRFVRIPVKVGRVSSLYAELTAGLTEGERVLLREPDPNQILREPWDPDKLKLVGFELDSNGKAIPTGGARPGGREAGRRNAANGRGRAGPPGAGQPADAGLVQSAEVKPTDSPADKPDPAPGGAAKPDTDDSKSDTAKDANAGLHSSEHGSDDTKVAESAPASNGPH
ncbi:MAG: HlyD family efflux transporter periplasmic adaptor subunit [Phycisphaerae bacterium]|nr:HlyD family efflux transporter periplasmic adaptor subunit [Phycisphaerae bacterium]